MKLEAMIIYSVTVSIENRIREDWLTWMQGFHIPDVMATGFFVSHRVCRLMEPTPEPGTVTYAVQYFCTDRSHLQTYLEEHAPALRQEHHHRFGDRAQAFRTVLEILGPATPSMA